MSLQNTYTDKQEIETYNTSEYFSPKSVFPPKVEIWRDLELEYIKPYYQISNLGKIKNKNTNRILKPQDIGGYESINLRTTDNGMKILFVHRLVAMVFMNFHVSRRDFVVHHINEDKHCNHINNLEVCTTSKNILYSKIMDNYESKNKISKSCTDSIEDEVWKDYHNYYVSNYGRIKNDKGYFLNFREQKGYMIVFLTIDNKPTNCRVHRLVAKVFLSNPDNKPVVNHKDGNKSNNNLNNLEWCSYKENIQHAHDTGLVNHNYFTYSEIEDILIEKFINNKTTVYISKKYNTSDQNIRNILHNKINKYKKVIKEICEIYNINI